MRIKRRLRSNIDIDSQHPEEKIPGMRPPCWALLVVLLASPVLAQKAAVLRLPRAPEPLGEFSSEVEEAMEVPAEPGLSPEPVFERLGSRLYLGVTQVVAIPPEHPQEPPQLEPALKAAWRATPLVSLGVEYVGTLGPVAQPSPLGEQSHRLFAAVDLDWTRALPRCWLNVALGYDFTGPEGWVGRLTLAFDLEPR
ncbi:MAG: hypothetical protein AB1938_03025 [Myxococcota bacterium]